MTATKRKSYVCPLAPPLIECPGGYELSWLLAWWKTSPPNYRSGRYVIHWSSPKGKDRNTAVWQEERRAGTLSSSLQLCQIKFNVNLCSEAAGPWAPEPSKQPAAPSTLPDAQSFPTRGCVISCTPLHWFWSLLESVISHFNLIAQWKAIRLFLLGLFC